MADVLSAEIANLIYAKYLMGIGQNGCRVNIPVEDLIALLQGIEDGTAGVFDIGTKGDGIPVYHGKEGVIAYFKSIKGEDGISVSLSESGEELIIGKSYVPILTAPSLTLSHNAGVRELGETIDLVLSNTFDRGLIKGKTEDGEWKEDAVQDYRSGLPVKHTIDGTVYTTVSVTQSKTITSYKVKTSETFNSSVEYSSGNQPKDSKGSDYDMPLAAGTVNASTTVNGGLRRYAASVSSIPTSGAQLRSTMLGTSVINTANVFTFGTGTTNRMFVIAVPSSKTLSQVKNMGTNEDLSFTLNTSITTIPDAGGDLQSYKVYTFTNAVAFNSNYTLQVTLN